MQYDYHAPPQIVFGWGRRGEVGRLAAHLGRRAWIISGSRTLDASGASDEITASLQDSGIEAVRVETISREPLVADVDRAVGELRRLGAAQGDFVLAMGGGSALDLGKAVAALVTQRHQAGVQDYLEGVGRGLKLVDRPLPVVALPTTGGTGSEATKNAVISSLDPPFKKSLRSPEMLPKLVLVDPELGRLLPATTTAYSGMDALCQLIESYLSRRAQPIPQALAISGIALVAESLPRAVHEPENRAAREGMAHAALLSGLALANSGLGMAHGVAAALGVHCQVPHGLACTVMLPVAMRENLNVREALLAQIGEQLTGRTWPSTRAAAEAAIDHVERLCEAIRIPRRLSELGVRADQLPAIVAGSRGNSMSGNPRDLSDDELTSILEPHAVIVAAGLTPAWQQVLVFDSFQPGEVNRAAEAHWCASGKPINVALAAHTLGRSARCVTVVGGPTGDAVEKDLNDRNVDCRLIRSPAPTRVCTTVVERTRGVVSELVAEAQPIDSAALVQVTRTLIEEAAAADLVVLTGSLPAGVAHAWYRDILAAAPTRAIVDIRGPELLAALRCKPLLVKPNREELAKTFARPLDDDRQLVDALAELRHGGAEWVLVTQGKRTAWASGPEALYRIRPPSVDSLNPIGSGDALAAGIACALVEGRDMIEAIRFGMAAATDNARTLLPAHVDRQRVEALIGEVEVETV